MKANYKRDKEIGGVVKKKMVLTKEEIGKYLEEEWESKRDAVYSEVKNDVANQLIAVFFTALHKDFGFGKTRLIRAKESIETYFSLMQTGVFNKSFTPIDCINYLRDELGIDIDKGGNLFK